MDILADNGILLRLVDPGSTWKPIIEHKILTMELAGDRFLTAHQNYAEFWNVCTRPKAARGGLGLSISETENRMNRLEITFGLLGEHENAFSIWRKLVVAHKVHGKQVHDARLVALMLAHGITHIMTLNVADFTRYPQITVVDPNAP